jgi:predicted transcriptional regulator
MEKREPIEIKMDVMEFLFNYRTQKVSRIMHACGLRHDLCKDYLTELTGLQFIRKNENDEYEIMDKGIEFLRRTTELYKSCFPIEYKKLRDSRIFISKYQLPEDEKLESKNGGTV